MLKPNSNALRIVDAILGKVTGIKKPVAKFVIHIVELWLGMNCRYVFSNMERWGEMTEKSYRNGFKKPFDWFNFNFALLKQYGGKEVTAVFDPSHIGKSGKRTYGLHVLERHAPKGIEGYRDRLPRLYRRGRLHGEAVQTPPPGTLKAVGKTLVNHYVEVVMKRIDEILSITRYLAVDGYFMKKEFINPLLARGLQIITKARSDANLVYLFKGKQKTGKGRKKLYDGKIDMKNIDKRRFRCCYSDGHMKVYAGEVYCVLLKCNVLAAFIYYGDKPKPEIIICTDTGMEAVKMCKYYGLRFQVEFLIRDAKQHTGLEDCMARDKEKLYTHFNIAMTTVSVAKAAYHLSVPIEQRGSFSMADIKMKYMNRLIVKRIFSNLGLDMSCGKIKCVFDLSLNFGRLRA